MIKDVCLNSGAPILKEGRRETEHHRSIFMVKKASSNAVKTPATKAKSGKKKAPAAQANGSPAIQLASRLDERLIRERAYGIWIEEGRPHGRDLAHWQRAHQELQREARYYALTRLTANAST
jgi:hypothetical protein